MKLFINTFLFVFTTAIVFSSCNNDITYGDQLKAEKTLIADFIKRNNIIVVEQLPTTNPWPANVYYKTKSTGLYIRITEKGDYLSPDSLEINDLIVFRYLQYTLNTKADTMSYQNTVDNAFPVTFNYYDQTQTQSCKGWHEAVSYMKYNNSEAKVILPSKLGFDNDELSVIPYGYDISIKIRK